MAERVFLCHAVSSACAEIVGVQPLGLMIDVVDAPQAA
jgi:hypothetical protein